MGHFIISNLFIAVIITNIESKYYIQSDPNLTPAWHPPLTPPRFNTLDLTRSHFQSPDYFFIWAFTLIPAQWSSFKLVLLNVTSFTLNLEFFRISNPYLYLGSSNNFKMMLLKERDIIVQEKKKEFWYRCKREVSYRPYYC